MYKRQEIMAERGTVANPAVATSAYYTPATPAVVPPVTSSAVSYTHLDVYKRQGIRYCRSLDAGQETLSGKKLLPKGYEL